MLNHVNSCVVSVCLLFIFSFTIYWLNPWGAICTTKAIKLDFQYVGEIEKLVLFIENTIASNYSTCDFKSCHLLWCVVPTIVQI